VYSASTSLFTTKTEVQNRPGRSTRSGDIFVTPDTQFVRNPVDNLFRMALKTSNEKYIHNCQIVSFGQKGNHPLIGVRVFRADSELFANPQITFFIPIVCLTPKKFTQNPSP